MQEVCDTLEQLHQEGVLKLYAVGGATAAGFHGEPLATRDIDVFVYIDPVPGQFLITLSPVFERLKELGFSEFEDEGLLVHGYPVQFLSVSSELEMEAVDSAMVVEWDNHRLRVMTPEHLAVIALTVGRPKDRARVVYLAELPNFDRQKLREILARFNLTAQWQEWAAALGLDS